MSLTQPEWLLLISALVLVGWMHRGLHLWRPLRIVCLLLITLILVNPQTRQHRPGLDLWVLIDRSDSAQAVIAPKLDEWQQLLESSQGSNDTLHYVDFAAEASVRPAQTSDSSITTTDQTRIPLAAQVALAGRDPRRAAKLLLLSDGYSTESLENLGERLKRAGMPLTYRIPTLDRTADTRLESFRVPDRVKPGEPLLMEIVAQGPPKRTARYRLLRDQELIANQTFTFDADGQARMRLIDRSPQPGSHRYTLALSDPQDTVPGNNQSTAWVMAESGPRVVLLSPYTNDPLANSLSHIGLPVQVVTDFSALNAGSLADAHTIIINDVPAHVLPNDFLHALRFYVTSQGGGLLMLGGKHSFGSGGYYESPIDEVLPVSMELKEDHKKLAVAMAIVLDRSGSMGISVTGGQTKMDLANAGAADTVNLLGNFDAITVLAVDSEPHTVVPLTGVGGNKDEIINRVRSIVSMGGGIYVYTGLKAAWQELKDAEAGQKHIILFADAADAEEPDQYKALLQKMTDAGATVSVIGLGSPSDSDADFLKDISTLGNGRIFFSQNPADIPSFFAQETVAVTRSAFIDEPVETLPTADWSEISPQTMAWPEQVDGYNLSYLRPRAASALNSQDEYRAPLVAFWRHGSGRTAAVTFAMSGPYSASVTQWSQSGDFLQTLARWLIGTQAHHDLGLRTRLDGNSLVLDLFYNDQWEQEHPGLSPSIVYQQLQSSEDHQGTWERIAPGHYQARLRLDAGMPYLGAVQWADANLRFGPVTVQENLEWETPASMLQSLKDTAQASGGGPINLIENVWQTDARSLRQSLRPWLLLLLATAFLAEAAWFRWGRS